MQFHCFKIPVTFTFFFGGGGRRRVVFYCMSVCKVAFVRVTYKYKGIRLVCLKECWTRDQKIKSLNPGRSGRVKFVCLLLCGVHFTLVAVLLQWHIKDTDDSAKHADGRLHLYMHTHLNQQSRGVLTVLLSRHIVGTYPETSFHATCHGTFSHNCLSCLSHCGLILG